MKWSFVVCGFGWVSAFVMAWAMVFEQVKVSSVSWFFFAFFVVTGLLAGVQTMRS